MVNLVQGFSTSYALAKFWVEKKAFFHKSSASDESSPPAAKSTRLQCPTNFSIDKCFFGCDLVDNTLHPCQTFQLDQSLWRTALEMKDTEMISEGDMMALGAQLSTIKTVYVITITGIGHSIEIIYLLKMKT